MRQAKRVIELTEAGQCVLDVDMLLAVQELCDEAKNISVAYELVELLTATLDNVLLHHERSMRKSDAVTRRELVKEAEDFLANHA